MTLIINGHTYVMDAGMLRLWAFICVAEAVAWVVIGRYIYRRRHPKGAKYRD